MGERGEKVGVHTTAQVHKPAIWGRGGRAVGRDGQCYVTAA